MPEVTKDEAVKLLTRAVEKELPADELLEIYNELFPEKAYAPEKAYQDTTPIIQGLVRYINSGLLVEEIVDRWQLFLPKHHNVWYNEEEDRISYDKEEVPAPTEYPYHPPGCVPIRHGGW